MRGIDKRGGWGTAGAGGFNLVEGVRRLCMSTVGSGEWDRQDVQR